jgi:Ferredoxin-dependent bilin reductase
VVEEVMRRFRVVEELVKARLEVDVAGVVSGVRARLESRLQLKPIPVAADLGDREGPLGWGRIRTTAWEAGGYRKIVLSHVSLRPVIEGFALVLLPQPKLAAPVFACDLMALPTRVSVNADVYGSEPLGPITAQVLAPLVESFARLGSRPGPEWAAGIAAGGGLHAKVSPRVVDDAFAAVTASLARYLEITASAVEGPGGAEAQRAFFSAFHEHGPRRGMLGRLFGADWADRYSRLIFE